MSDSADSYTLECVRLDDGSFAGTSYVVPDEERTDGETDEIEIIASTERVASDGAIIDLETWRTDPYLRQMGKVGPVLQDHRMDLLIGAAHRTLRDKDGRVLRAWYRHRTDDAPAAVEARARRAQGYRIPPSVRWFPAKVVRADQLPREHRHYTDKPTKRALPWGGEVEFFPMVHFGATLREISETVIPADPGAAVVRAAQGIAPIVGVDPTADSLDERVADAIRSMLKAGTLNDLMAEAVATYAASLPRPKTVAEQAWGY